MIGHLCREEFIKTLHTHLSPTSPIQSQEHLFGRGKQLQLIDQALCAPGRSIFIYGDRGVGKTSLAHTVAYSHQAAMHDPVLLACTPHTTFADLMADATSALQVSTHTRSAITHSVKLGHQGLGIELGRTRQDEFITDNRVNFDLNSIIAELSNAAAVRTNQETVVVIDEFDRIANPDERANFADFIKQIGDQRVPIRFVFCGVAESMQTLLGAHGSCYRYLDGIELKALSWDARFEIIDAAAKALGVVIDSRPRYRIASISDGFPYYVHRMCEQLFWQMFNDPLPCIHPSLDHYREAVAESVLGIEQHLKQTYDQAILKGAPGYEQVLWAMADHADLIRSTESIYDSYVHLFGSSEDCDDTNSTTTFLLDRPTLVSRLNSLKGRSGGCILATNKRGWYHFRENIMRGYVRLRAEEQGRELALDYSAVSRSAGSLRWQRGARKAKPPTRPEFWDD